MKAISTALAQHLASEVPGLATCWRSRAGMASCSDSPTTSATSRPLGHLQSGKWDTRSRVRGTADLAIDNLYDESVFSADGSRKKTCGLA